MRTLRSWATDTDDLSRLSMRGRYHGVAPVVGGAALDRTPPATLWLGLAALGLIVAVGQVTTGPRRDRRIAALTQQEVRHEALVG